MSNPRLIAYYLPQFHPIPENDEWWGKGFTEWTNVGKAKPLFPGHQQPKVPGELGYYDLRVPETRQAQADLAREYGIEGFCYWHYWFGNGKQLLERPFNEVLESGKPDFPFCLAWANESWSGFWHGTDNRNTLIEQLYPGQKDIEDHFYALLQAFKDPRYIKVDGKPLINIFKPLALPDASVFIHIWKDLAVKNDLQGMYFVGQAKNEEETYEIRKLGFDAVNLIGLNRYKAHRKQLKYSILAKYYKLMYGCPNIGFYKDAMRFFISGIEKQNDVFPTIVPNWDHSPRTHKEGFVLHGSSPELFSKHLLDVKKVIQDKDSEHNIVFIKSWNEWAEGNYMEPDIVFGRRYLEVMKETFSDKII